MYTQAKPDSPSPTCKLAERSAFLAPAAFPSPSASVYSAPEHGTGLQRAVDALELACAGLSNRHITAIGAAEAQVIVTAIQGHVVTPLRIALANKQGRQRVWTTVAVLRPILEHIESGNPSALAVA